MTSESKYSDYLIYIEFIEGYSVRNLFDYLRQTHKQTNNNLTRFVFSKNQIRLTEFNRSDNLVNQMIIANPQQDLPRYFYNSENDSGEKKCLFVTVEINELKTHFRNMTKKDGVKLWILKSDPEMLHIVPNTRNLGTQDSQDKWIKILRDQDAEDFDDLTLPTEEPSATKLLANFCKDCSSNVGIRCKEILCYGGTDFVEFQSLRDGDVSGLTNRFGERNSNEYHMTKDVDGNEIKFVIRIKPHIIKALSKMTNITGSNQVRLYMKSESPLCITTSVGNYGRLTIFIGDKNIPLSDTNE